MFTRSEPGLTVISDGAAGGGLCDRGPPEDIEQVVLRDGSSVIIGLLAAGDEAAIANWFASCFAELDADTLYARLFVLLRRLDPRAWRTLARGDHFEHEAITAFAPNGVTVGIARYLRVEEASSAEVTVAVADDWRGRGLASTLLERLAARTRSVGIEQLTARCPASDRTLIRLLSRLGATTAGPSNGELVDIRIGLNKHDV